MAAGTTAAVVLVVTGFTFWARDIKQGLPFLTAINTPIFWG